MAHHLFKFKCVLRNNINIARNSHAVSVHVFVCIHLKSPRAIWFLAPNKEEVCFQQMGGKIYFRRGKGEKCANATHSRAPWCRNCGYSLQYSALSSNLFRMCGFQLLRVVRFVFSSVNQNRLGPLISPRSKGQRCGGLFTSVATTPRQ